MAKRPTRKSLRAAGGLCCLTVLSILPLPWLQEQKQPVPASQTPIIHAERNEVDVVVTVRDSRGQPVADLKESNFQILDNGRPQKISSFAIQGSTQQVEDGAPLNSEPRAATPSNPAPIQRRFLALFFDDENSEGRMSATAVANLQRAKSAAEQFVQTSMQPEDRVAIFKSSGNRDVAFTNDKQKILAEIAGLKAHDVGYHGESDECPYVSNYEGYAIANNLDPQALEQVMERAHACLCPPETTCPLSQYMSVAQRAAADTWQSEKNVTRDLLAEVSFAVRMLGTMPDKRILMLVSRGFFSQSSDPEVSRITDDALRARVVISSLSTRGLEAFAARSQYQVQHQNSSQQSEVQTMAAFADSTGGALFQNNNDLLRGFDQLATPELAYVLAFSPDPLKHDGKFHKLKVEVKTPARSSVYAREGYYAPTEKEFEAANVRPVSEPPPAAISSSTASSASPAEASKPAEAAPPMPADAAGISAQPSAEASAASLTAPQPLASTSPEAPANGAPPAGSAVPPKTPEEVAAQRASEIAFLNRASQEVEHYIKAFADLTADETREMETFGPGGRVSQKRAINSELVVYRLRSDPRQVIEFRDVTSIDGKSIKGHAERATKIWTQVAKAHNAAEELKLIRQDSERYDIGLEETGFTLYEGLPLRQACAGAFVFGELAPGSENGRPTRIFNYAQKAPCEIISYHFALPPLYASVPLVHAGQLVLDAKTAQIIREERSVYLGNFHGQRAAHLVLGYTDSSFGLLLPQIIVIELFAPPQQVSNPLYTPSMSAATPNGGDAPGPPPGAAKGVLGHAKFVLHARMVQTYGPFSRFEVNVVQKVSAPTR